MTEEPAAVLMERAEQVIAARVPKERQQALAKEPMLLAWLDDLSRYEANPVLAVADE